MVMVGRSVHLTPLFDKQYFVHILSLVTDNNPSRMIHSAEGRRMIVEIILFHDQSPQKYVTGLGSNSQPLDLQLDTHL